MKHKPLAALALCAFCNMPILAHEMAGNDSTAAINDVCSVASRTHDPCAHTIDPNRRTQAMNDSSFAAATTGEGKTIHRIAVEAEPGAILHTNEYLYGLNPEGRTMNHAFTANLKYAFMARPGSEEARIYKDCYQGVGVALHRFNPQLGNPVSAYVFQGAKIAGLSRRLSLNYEWNFGMAFGWKPYNQETNPDNRVIGSKATAYINLGFYLKYFVSKHLDIYAGASVSHFSNGNTSYPNAGLNTLGGRIGLAYYVNRPGLSEAVGKSRIPEYKRRVYYDLIVFGAWRKRGRMTEYGGYMLPGTYSVFGFNFNPMVGLNHWVSVGASLDGLLDRSANLLKDDDGIGGDTGKKPPISDQMALGLSARAELTMLYFAINVGIGTNVVNRKGDFRGIYEILALKIKLTKRMMLHIGYELNKFKEPNHLMLGAGWRFGKIK